MFVCVMVSCVGVGVGVFTRRHDLVYVRKIITSTHTHAPHITEQVEMILKEKLQRAYNVSRKLKVPSAQSSTPLLSSPLGINQCMY